ncbi:hypothetical protein T01_16268 [Trichinella spiralis]|uniref:Uncharacterized protein n=1 Tax=Trichinella spiralis TaxID=6334 RepID=A0A0V1AKH4_TRISP|nr:hypothetical protein T01_16268 [Trichinella spiralis]
MELIASSTIDESNGITCARPRSIRNIPRDISNVMIGRLQCLHCHQVLERNITSNCHVTANGFQYSNIFVASSAELYLLAFECEVYCSLMSLLLPIHCIHFSSDA